MSLDATKYPIRDLILLPVLSLICCVTKPLLLFPLHGDSPSTSHFIPTQDPRRHEFSLPPAWHLLQWVSTGTGALGITVVRCYTLLVAKTEHKLKGWLA